MQLSQFVTDYDESLSGDSYIDPMGELVIWSTFGGEIFHGKVNSISNDVRNYTLNLLNHAVIRHLIEDNSVEVGKWLAAEIGDKHSLSFRQACLVYLENIFSYVMVSAESDSGIDTAGILGGSKARLGLDGEADPELILSHKASAHLLVRQLTLGVSGRYKTPFMSMDFYDGNYHYHLPKSSALWEKTLQLFSSQPALGELYSQACTHLATVINESTAKRLVPPTRYLSELPESLKAAYRAAMATPGVVGAQTRDFWLDLTGLDRGAAGALLGVLDDWADQGSEASQQDDVVFAQALKRCLKAGEVNEASAVQHILTVEPLLAEADLLFTLALHQRNQSVADVEANWRALGRDEQTLPSAAAAVRAMPSLQPVLIGTASRRLEKLLIAAESETVEEQLRLVLEYHRDVMRGRGQLPWVAASGAKQIKVEARTRALPDPKKRPPGTWVNEYYLSQFRNLVDGYRGVVA